MTDRRLLAEPFRQFLRDRGVSQKDFAAYIGVHETHLSRLLSGTERLTYEMGVRIAAGLGVRHGAVMDPPDPPGPKEPIHLAARPEPDEAGEAVAS